MARNWKRYYKRRYRKYYKNKYGSNYGSRGYGQMKAAKQQADQASFVMNIPTQISCKCVKGTVGNRQVELGTYPMNIYDLLRKSEFYQSYANMYDEFKIDNIKVKLIPVKYNVTVGDVNNAGYQSFTVYTAWDRTGLNGKQLYLNTASGVYNNEPINPNSPNGAKNYDYIGKAGDFDGVYCLVGSDITTYSSAESRQVSVGQNSSIVRWLKPKTLSEKSQWLSTAQLKAWYTQYSNTDALFRYIPTSNMDSYLSDISKLTNLNDRSIGAALNSISPAIANNPCFLEEDPSVSFKPTLLVGLYPADPEETELPRTVYFNVETEVSCSFRGLRKSKVVSNDDDVYIAAERANRVVVRLDEEDLDQAMDVEGQNNQQNNRILTTRNSNLNDLNINAITREFLTANPEYGVINIQDFLNNPHVIHNPSGENYATSLQILLPWAETVTPMVADSIKIFKLDENNNPEEILDTLSMDDATLVDDGESFEVERGDVVFMVKENEEDNPATTDKDEKKWWQKVGAFIADGSKTIWNTGKKAAVWVWKHGGEQAAQGALKVGVGLAVDYLTGGQTAAAAHAIGGVAQSFLNGSQAPLAIDAPIAQNTTGQLLPYNNRNMRKSNTRAYPNGYPDITNETNLEFNSERFVQISYSVIKLPTGFWTNLLNRKLEKTK